ncbi:MAG TPA: hypothetical protein VG934_01245 [Candidatus Paceibacterota bacterium]|nr:hypothetical protein [Candidatus Paceibacterota bacterium]
MNKTIIGAIIAVIIVGGGAFYAGTVYGKSSGRGQFGGGNFTLTNGVGGARTFTRGGTGAGGAAGGFTAGKVISNSGTSISIQEQNGSSTEIVLVGPSTQILKSDAGTASDLTVGTEVTVTGSSNSDGSLTANSIQIRPAGMGEFSPRGTAQGQ